MSEWRWQGRAAAVLATAGLQEIGARVERRPLLDQGAQELVVGLHEADLVNWVICRLW
jgi:hypothetical protein